MPRGLRGLARVSVTSTMVEQSPRVQPHLLEPVPRVPHPCPPRWRVSGPQTGGRLCGSRRGRAWSPRLWCAPLPPSVPQAARFCDSPGGRWTSLQKGPCRRARPPAPGPRDTVTSPARVPHRVPACGSWVLPSHRPWPVACGSEARAGPEPGCRDGPRTRGAHRVGGGPLLGRGVVGILPNVELVRWKEMDVRLLEALEDGPWNGHRPYLSSVPRTAPPRGWGSPHPLPRTSPFFISWVSWSC